MISSLVFLVVHGYRHQPGSIHARLGCAPFRRGSRTGERFHRKRMNQKELKELIEFLIEKDIAEFELERGDVKVRIKRGAEAPVSTDARYFGVHSASPAAPEAASIPTPVPSNAAPTVPQEPAPEPEEPLHTVRSPIVGTFYEAPSPGAPPFVKVGDLVEVG